jgi:hypothetical protein
VTGILEPSQEQKGHQIADMEAGGSRVEARVQRDGPIVEAASERVEVGAVVHETSGLQVIDELRTKQRERSCLSSGILDDNGT